MTIEIRQLIVRAVVESGQATPGPGRADPYQTATLAANAEPRPPTLTAAERRGIVADCVREVLRQIERERER